jgi:hypothetical protein
MDAIKNVVALAVAVLALVATALLIVFLLGKVGDENWERYVYLLSGVEAIAFAATGWLFGKEVHREQAQTAEAGRKDAERTKDLALSEAADQRRKGVETARGMVLSLDQAVALSAAPGASQVDAAREGLRGYAKSAYADELSDL